MLDALRFRLGESKTIANKTTYPMGTASADAYFAGCDEGHRIARDHLNKDARA